MHKAGRNVIVLLDANVWYAGSTCQLEGCKATAARYRPIGVGIFKAVEIAKLHKPVLDQC